MKHHDVPWRVERKRGSTWVPVIWTRQPPEADEAAVLATCRRLYPLTIREGGEFRARLAR